MRAFEAQASVGVVLDDWQARLACDARDFLAPFGCERDACRVLEISWRKSWEAMCCVFHAVPRPVPPAGTKKALPVTRAPERRNEMEIFKPFALRL